MSTLQENLDTIKLDKDTNLKPENLKKGITCLGVTGTYEGSGGGTVEGIKQFATIEEMNNSTGNKEGDLAVVYRSEIQNATVDSHFQVATFPNTVVLDTTLTDGIEVRYRAVDSSVMFDCWGQLDSSRFRMDCYTETENIRIRYTSSDGITYTRTDTTGNPVDFGTEIYYEMTEMWNDAIGKFIQIGGNTFEGIFKYEKNNVDKNGIKFIPLTELNPAIDLDNNMIINTSIGNERTDSYNPNTIMEILSNYSELDGMLSNNNCYIYLDKNNNLATCQIKIKDTSGNISAYGSTPKIFVNNSDVTQFLGIGIYWGGVSDANRYELEKYIINLTDKTITLDTSVTPITKYLNTNGISTPTDLCIFIDDSITVPVHITDATIDTGCINSVTDTNEKTYYQDSNNNQNDTKYPSCYVLYDAYLQAPTQLTAIADNVYETEFYGKNGIEVGTLTQNISNSFTDTNAELYGKIQNYYDNLEPRVLTNSDKTIDKNIYCIPVKRDGTVLLDTSSVTNMSEMFYNCHNLTEIPLLNTSSVTNMMNVFNRCTNLTIVPLLDTSKVANMSGMFAYCANLTTIPLLNTSSVTNMNCMFYNCTNLIEIPLLGTSSVTDMGNMFSYCTNLTTIPLLDTSKVTGMQYMFSSCNSLSDESLNNILAMCTNATSYTRTKTLKYIGLTSEQATKCQSLSNYSAFTSAGWTTGY